MRMKKSALSSIQDHLEEMVQSSILFNLSYGPWTTEMGRYLWIVENWPIKIRT